MRIRRELGYCASLRVDLSGGTLDLPPIYLFHLPCYTINVAIGLDATVRYKPREDGRWVFKSLDLGTQCEWRPDDDFAWADRAGAGIAVRVVSHFGLGEGGELVTSIEAPPGSGLGGSSALATALVALALRIKRSRLDPEGIVGRARAMETLVMEMPCGLQDYIAALWGGGSIISYDLDGWKRVPIRARFVRTLCAHLLVVYAGKPHFSGTNNWALYRSYFEGEAQTRILFARLAENSRRMAQAVSAGNLEEVATVMMRDWEDRKSALPEMTTNEIENIIQNTMSAGACSARVCGAGGGGAIAFLVPPERWKQCASAATEAGGVPLTVGNPGEGLRESITK
ncbi:MAG: GHMP family kinase ATP-binding protein [bacterium JZ-2024 1]